MAVEILGVMIPIIAVIGIVFIIIFLRKYENTERMAMIEKGVDADLFKRQTSTSAPLRLSLLFIGVGVGLLFGYFLSEVMSNRPVAFISMTFIFGGIGLGVAYLIEDKKIKQDFK
jgi:F0F1-type ATP synthase assembly protein I